MGRVAVVLFNLGGPDELDSVEPFLFNLFNDRAIIGLPQPLRWLLAKLISKRRAPVARRIYAQMGGGSPLLPETEAQARALEQELADLGEVRAFTAMRYWHPQTAETVAAVRDFAPERIVLLPLYPQYSTTTSASSLKRWNELATDLTAPVSTVCCYPTLPGMAQAQAERIAECHARLAGERPPRLLFSAHGLPQKVIDSGDPYQWQVEQTARAIVVQLEDRGLHDLEWTVCYQSQVGPLKWIGPSTEEEIVRAGQNDLPVIVVPLAFVSEHSETLVELDIEYRELAVSHGVTGYERVPALGVAPAFIKDLAKVVRDAVGRESADPACAEMCGSRRLCPAQWGRCAVNGNA